MYQKIEKWLDNLPLDNQPESIVAYKNLSSQA